MPRFTYTDAEPDRTYPAVPIGPDTYAAYTVNPGDTIDALENPDPSRFQNAQKATKTDATAPDAP